MIGPAPFLNVMELKLLDAVGKLARKWTQSPLRAIDALKKRVISRLIGALESGNLDGISEIQRDADGLFVHARDCIHAVPYNKVTLETRTDYAEAALLRAASLLAAHNHNTKKRKREGGSTDREGDCGRSNIFIEALKVLDVALLVSGPTEHRETILEMADKLQAYLAVSGSSTESADNADVNGSSVPAVKRPRLGSPKSLCAPQILHPVPELDPPPSLISFSNSLRSSPQPFIIRNALSDWPALSTRPWSERSYLLKTIGPHRTVPVELGARYTDSTWSQNLLPFSEFLDAIWGPAENITYLAQHDLFAQCPALSRDILVPDYCFVGESEEDDEVRMNAWVGPAGTVSPLHTDPYHNFFAQVVGSKYVRLVAPEHSEKVYPHDSMLNNTSQVDVENPDLESFPLFAAVPCVECIVGPSDLLFIPRGWWHYVRSLSVSFSVSFWFS